MKKIFSVLLIGSMLSGLAPVMAAEEPIISNDFETGELGFGVRGTASVVISTDAARSGTSSMLVSERGANAWEGVNTSIVNDIKLDETYYGQMYVKAAVPGESFTVKMSIDMEDETGAQYPQIGSAVVNSSDWTLVEGTWTADYQGNLKAMNLDLETGDDGIGKSFYVDDIFFAHESVSKPQNIQLPQNTNTDVTYSGIVLPDDVLETEYVEYVEKMMVLGVVQGYPDGSFMPDNKVTRAEFLTMLLRLFNIEIPSSSSSGYTDVAADHFASGAENIRSQEGHVVTKVMESLNRDDEQVKCLEVYINGEKKSYVMRDPDVWNTAVADNNNKSIEEGDIVRFDTDSYGQISNLAIDKGTGKYNDYFYSAQGYIYLKEDGYAYFTTKRPNDSMSFDDMLLIPIDGFDIVIYDKDSEDVYEGVSGDIIDYMTDSENYSSVYITMSYENPKTLICVTEN